MLIELFGKLGLTVGVLKMIPLNGSIWEEKVSRDQSKLYCRIPIPTPAAPLYLDFLSFPLKRAALDIVNSFKDKLPSPLDILTQFKPVPSPRSRLLKKGAMSVAR